MRGVMGFRFWGLGLGRSRARSQSDTSPQPPAPSPIARLGLAAGRARTPLGTAIAGIGLVLLVLSGLPWVAELQRAGATPEAAVELGQLAVTSWAEAVLEIARPSADAALIEAGSSLRGSTQMLTRAGTAERLAIPRIAVDSQVVDVYVKNGEWPVPKFIVGHLGETVNPGDVGNAVFAGHLLSISLGNVFAKLGELEVGDEMTFSSEDGNKQFVVTESFLVSNKEVDVLKARPGKATVTLITCAGRWNTKEQDYEQRRIVVAEVVKA